MTVQSLLLKCCCPEDKPPDPDPDPDPPGDPIDFCPTILELDGFYNMDVGPSVVEWRGDADWFSCPDPPVNVQYFAITEGYTVISAGPDTVLGPDVVGGSGAEGAVVNGALFCATTSQGILDRVGFLFDHPAEGVPYSFAFLRYRVDPNPNNSSDICNDAIFFQGSSMTLIALWTWGPFLEGSGSGVPFPTGAGELLGTATDVSTNNPIPPGQCDPCFDSGGCGGPDNGPFGVCLTTPPSLTIEFVAPFP